MRAGNVLVAGGIVFLAGLMPWTRVGMREYAEETSEAVTRHMGDYSPRFDLVAAKELAT